MKTISCLGAIAAAAIGCSQPGVYQPSTMPQAPLTQPSWYGPPGGNMDPQLDQQPQYDPSDQQQPPQDPNGYVDPNAAQPGGQVDVNVEGYVQPDQQDPTDQIATNDVTDGDINSTLAPYGQWEDVDGYGRVWRPDATVVGVDFTPYETCGSWVWTRFGWTYSCDYSWGWLPFHYGRWGWFNGYWGWQPGYTWGPAWCDWRHGGGYVGWRPMMPIVRDHRFASIVQPHDSHWRFVGQNQLGLPHVHSHLYTNPAEGLRVTQPVAQLPVRGTHVVPMSTVMHTRPSVNTAVNRVPQRPAMQPPNNSTIPRGQQQPTWRPQQQTYRPPAQTVRPGYQQQPTWRPQQTYRPPAQTYRPPAQTYRSPAQTYRPPAQTYRPPAQSYRPSYSAPSHSYSAPSHSYSAPSHSYSAPSHSSSSSSSSSSSGGGHSGGGHHR